MNKEELLRSHLMDLKQVQEDKSEMEKLRREFKDSKASFEDSKNDLIEELMLGWENSTESDCDRLESAIDEGRFRDAVSILKKVAYE